MTVGILLLANLALFAYLYFIDRGNIIHYLSFKTENIKLKYEYKKELRDLFARVEKVSDAHQQSLEQIAEVETITGFRDFDPKDFLNAQGGPESPVTFAPTEETDVGDVRKQIDAIDQDHKQIRERLEKIQVFVRANEERMHNTPVGWPVHGWVSSGFGWRTDPWTGRYEHHDGVDISAFYGTPIRAAADGIVRVANSVTGFGTVVVLTHNYGYETYYGHMSRAAVQPKAKVARGDIIGYVGSSGRSTGTHAHYEIRVNNRPVDPLPYLGLMP